MSFWTGVRLPPAPLIFIRRDPPKVGGILVKHADGCERSSLFNASAPLVLKLRKSNLYIGLEMCSKKIQGI